MTDRPRLGLLVNPIAGMGGRVGLHGTDGSALHAARSRGADTVAPFRARRALARLHGLAPTLPVLTVAGAMGADHLPGEGWSVETLAHLPAEPSTAADTRRAARQMVEARVGLLLFVGGDGTARDVLEAVGTEVPMLGVPSGVKMHSGVFATGPEVAGDTAAAFLADPEQVGSVDAEVVDLIDLVDHSGRGAVRPSPRMFGLAKVPNLRSSVPRAKSVTDAAAQDKELAALGREVAAEMRPDRLYLLGPGATVAHVSAALGLPASVLGVDAVLDGRLLAADATEAELLALLHRFPVGTLVLGVVGGQGFLLGRGNQQISAAVLAALGSGGIEILAARGKVAALDPPVLLVDVDGEVDADGDNGGMNGAGAGALASIIGYRRVRTGPGHSTVLRVVV